MKKIDSNAWFRWILPLLLASGILVFLIKKSIVMQITHDEAYTVQQLTDKPFWDLVTYKSSYTNNHILNTLLTKGLFWLFGSTNHSLARVPNVLAFGFYFYFCWRFAQQFIADNWVSLMFVCVMCCNPYLLDFFSLCRGYGLSICFLMGSVYFATQFVVDGHRRSLPLSILLSVLSVYSQFATLHFYLGLNLVLCLFLLQKYVKTKESKGFFYGLGVQILGLMLLVLLIYLPITAIIRDNQIAYYGKEGFWQNTMSSLISCSLYAKSYLNEATIPTFKLLTILLFSFVLAYISFVSGEKTHAQSKKTYPSVWVTFLFFSTALSVILQFHLLGNQYVVDRTALFFYPLLAMLMPIIPVFTGRFKRWASILACLLFIIFSLNHVKQSCNLKASFEWWYDVHTYEILDMMELEYEKTDKKRPLQLQTSWIFNPSFLYHRNQNKLEWLATPVFISKPDTVNVYDFYYSTRDDLPFLLTKYEKVKEWDWGQYFLLKRR